MKKLAFLSCDSLDGYVSDDNLLVQELTPRFEVDTVSWSKKIDWSAYDAVIVRTTWDYMHRPKEFLAALKDIQLSGTKLFNPFSIVSWNIHKFYLKELQDSGINIVPTVFLSANEQFLLPENWDGHSFVVKPAISASANRTKILGREEVKNFRATNEEWLIQPFIENVIHGEISLIFFDKKFSHSLLKVPKDGDFRVQEEHGGRIQPYSPDPEIINLGHEILSKIELPLLYARVDLINYDDKFCLMELELIEPSLYFRIHTSAAKNFRNALQNFI